jgi:hypothetical protein
MKVHIATGDSIGFSCNSLTIEKVIPDENGGLLLIVGDGEGGSGTIRLDAQEAAVIGSGNGDLLTKVDKPAAKKGAKQH